MFGTDRILQALNEVHSAQPQKLLGAVQENVDAFVGDAQRFDDQTMLGITLH